NLHTPPQYSTCPRALLTAHSNSRPCSREREMKGTRQEAAWTALVIGVLLVVGCTSDARLVGVTGPGQGVPTGPPSLPTSDAGLADHVPQQIVIGVLP